MSVGESVYTPSDVTEDLTAAAMWGDVQLLEGLLKNEADPNLPNSQGNTALHVACYYGERECASLLLNFKAAVNAKGADGKTPLHRAVSGVLVLEPGPKYMTTDQIQENQIDLVKLLVGRGAKVSVKDNSDDTPYDLALQCDFYKCAELLSELAKSEQQEEIRHQFYQKIDAIYDSCKEGDLEKVKELMSHVKIILNECKKNQKTLLMIASEEGHLPIVEYLIEQGATVTLTPDRACATALHFASENGHKEIVACLLQHLPNILKYDDSPKGSSLHLAARNGHSSVVDVLLERATRSFMQRTPCKSDDPFVSSLDTEPINEYTVNVLLQSPFEGRTPLHEAVIGGHTNIVQSIVKWIKEYHNNNKKHFLSSSGLSPLPSPHGPPPVSPRTPSTPLTSSSGTLTRTPTQTTINPLDIMTEMGRTPLHEATRLGYTDMIQILQDGGADINSVMRPSLDRTANADLTALVEAAMRNDAGMVQFLLKHGATDARLKALTRVLRIPYNDVAGLLLCYNGTVTVDSGNIELRKRAGKECPNSPLLLSVNWASKKLPYVTPSWLELVLIEAPKPKAEFYGISQLNVSDNKLAELPIAIFQLNQLIRLDVSRNNISELPMTANWKCTSLTHFDVSHNHLKTLPTVLFTLPELKELNCTSNAIRDLPLELWLAPKLTKLLLQRNKLTSFPSPSFSNDSGFGTWETMPPADMGLYNSFSVPDFSLTPGPTSPPMRNARTSKRDSYHVLARNRLQTSPTDGTQTILAPMDRRTSAPPSTNVLRSRLRQLFDTTAVDDDPFDDYEMTEVVESSITSGGNTGLGGGGGKECLFQLESLDLSYNELTSIPLGLCCLAPKLLKLTLHHNNLSSLGSITDFPADLELLDACNNRLTTVIACARPREALRNLACAQKLLQLTGSHDSMTPTRCSHRNHRVLRKLSYLKLAHNELVDVQLFRTAERNHMTDLTSSMDESRFTRRSKTSIDIGVSNSSGGQRDFSKSSFGGRITKESISSTEDGSSSSGGDKKSNNTVEVLYCLYPQLSTVDLGSNKLRSVPAHIQLISSLAVLTISHNTDIDTLPLELSNLEGLWSLEYDGVPLTNPPASDLDKFRSAADKLLYMRSLLHDAKPYESMKLMLVGLQKQGKTTLLSRLREINEVRTPVSTFNERIEGESVTVAASVKPSSGFFTKKPFGVRDAPLSTVGVDLGVWKYRRDLEPTYKGKRTATPLRSVTFYTWDFGGQEEYYATHQCFLSNRSLYLVIFNTCDGEDGIDNLGLWLHNIQARAPESPVVIVGTHCDLLKGEVDRDTRKQELLDYLKEKYHYGDNSSKLRELGLPQIKDVMFVGCPSVGRTEGISELRIALYETAFQLTAPRKKGVIGGNKAKLLEQPIPSSYLKLEERIRELVMRCHSHPDMSPVKKEHEFYELVQDIIPNPRELNQAVTFLHENGILLHYATPALNHLYFMDPQWLCDMLAHVVTVPEVNRFIQRGTGPEAGILKTSVLSHIFKGKLFPHALRNEYIELLSKFEVALLLDRNRMLVPSMLPTAPAKTIYHFKTIFPRPPIAQLIQQSRFQLSTTAEDETDSFPQFSSLSDPLVMSSIPKSFSVSKSPDLYRTGLLLRRFYFMTYVPSGFWPRLISRFLTAPEFANIVLKSLGYGHKDIEDIVKLIISGDASTVVNLEWSYWTTGVELWYQGYSLLRVAEIRPEGTFQECLPPSSQGSSYSRTPSIPFEPSEDCEDLSFQLNGQWLAVDETPNTGLEIIIPDYICPSIIEKELPPELLTPNTNDEEEEESEDEPYPSRESSWMSAQLLSLTVQQIDTLLEDWFPGIGSKDGGKTLYSVPYVNRVVPCPYCVGRAEVPPTTCDVFTSQSVRGEPKNTSSVNNNSSSDIHATPKGTLTGYNEETDGAGSSRGVRRDLMPSLQQTATDASHKKHRPSDRDVSQEKSSSPPTTLTGEKGLGQGSFIQATRFGFMIEACVGASRGLQSLVCPSHPSQPLDIFSLTPDLVFSDLPSHFIIDHNLVNQGKFVASGSFGEIYHGAIYPKFAVSDDDGKEVAIKIDKQDRKHFNMETATKAYMEIRAEVALLKDLDHDYIIKFIGLTLQPLCFMLEWATQGSLHGILQSYNNTDARISPWTLVETARQVASGLVYLHSRNVVYYDLKSPNILVFAYPSADQSLQASLGYTPLIEAGKFPVHVKIADLGISRKLTPGGVVGYKGTPAFMAPEILRYVGKEACTEKVDVFSFGMFMYELLAQQFPFERQNLMHNQIEKLVVDGERPSIQTKELSNPILYLDIMRWAWEQDYHNRPSAVELEAVLEQSAIPHLVDAYSMKGFSYQKVISACVVTLPIDISAQISEETPSSSTSSDPPSLGPSITPYHANVVRGDLQEEVWFYSEEKDSTNEYVSSCLSIVSFRGRGNFVVECSELSDYGSITAMCGVSQQVWLGSDDGRIILYDALNHSMVFSRILAIKSGQGILSISHLTKLRQVLVVRCDGYLMLFDECLLEQKIPDTSHFDNHLNATQLPVRTVFNFKSPLYCTLTLSGTDESIVNVWCTSSNEIITVLDIRTSSISHCQKLKTRPYAETDKNDVISHLCQMKIGSKRNLVWALSSPGRMLYLWENYRIILTHSYDQYTSDKVTDVVALHNMLYISTEMGHIIILSFNSNTLDLSPSCPPVIAHDISCGIYKLLTLGSRVFPRHWIPTLIGRNNVIEYYRDLLDEDEITEINSRIIGCQSQLLLSLGRGFHGLTSSSKMIDSSLQDKHDNFVLLWLPPR